jgi:hypothetical protein
VYVIKWKEFIMKNSNLHRAKTQKNDEFYTQLTDVSKELMHYKKHFKDKIVLCNCDDPTWSAFWKYFHLNFAELGLKRLVSTHYEKSEYTFGRKKERSYVMVYEGGDDNDETVGIKTPLKGDGDFRSSECIEILKQCDIVVTNPPFSLFREFVAQLMEYNKDFLILGNQNAVTYKEFFPLIRDNKVWFGASIHSGGVDFQIPDNYETDSKNVFIKDGHHFINLAGMRWFTTLDYPKRHEKLLLWKQYTPEEYPKYDNYDAINVNATKDIPVDYDGVMGVPITFLDKYCPEQFEILDMNPHFFLTVEQGLPKPKQLTLHNVGRKDPYARVLIRKKVGA